MRGVPKSSLGSIQIEDQHAFHSASVKSPSLDFRKVFKSAAGPNEVEKELDGLATQASSKQNTTQGFQSIPAEQHGKETSQVAKLKDRPDVQRKNADPSADSQSAPERRISANERSPELAAFAAQDETPHQTYAKAGKATTPENAHAVEARKEHKANKARTGAGHAQKHETPISIVNKEEGVVHALTIPQQMHAQPPAATTDSEDAKGKKETASPGMVTGVPSNTKQVSSFDRMDSADTKPAQTTDHPNTNAPAASQERIGQKDNTTNLGKMESAGGVNQLLSNSSTVTADATTKIVGSMPQASQNPSHWSDGMVADGSNGVNESAGVSPGDPGQMHQVLKTGSKQLEVGVMDGTHGWLQIRAESGSAGSINASLTGSLGSHESLRQSLPEMTAYLASEQIKVSSISIHHGNETGASSEQKMSGNYPGTGHERGESPSSQWGGGQQSDERHRQRDEANPTGNINTGGAYGVATGGISMSQTENEASQVGGGYGVGSFLEGAGSWLNVIA